MCDSRPENDPSQYDKEFEEMLALASFIGENREKLPHDVPTIRRMNQNEKERIGIIE